MQDMDITTDNTKIPPFFILGPSKARKQRGSDWRVSSSKFDSFRHPKFITDASVNRFFTLVKKLSDTRTQYSNVYLATRNDVSGDDSVLDDIPEGTEVAVKIHKNCDHDDALESKLVESTAVEVGMLLYLASPKIVIPMLVSFRDETHASIVMPVAFADMWDVCTRSPEFREGCDWIGPVFLKCFDILTYLHLSGVMHRDIKPDNLLLMDKADPKSMCIADFGLSRIIIAPDKEKLRLTNMVYTSCYRDPLVMMSPPYSYSFGSDMFAMAITMLDILLGDRMLFESNDDNDQNLTTSFHFYTCMGMFQDAKKIGDYDETKHSKRKVHLATKIRKVEYTLVRSVFKTFGTEAPARAAEFMAMIRDMISLTKDRPDPVLLKIRCHKLFN
jgi:serine/threonine protein kinase